MKLLLLPILLLTSFASFGQNISKQLKKVKTLEQSNAFIQTNKNLEPQLLTITSDKDSSDVNKILLKQKTGEIFTADNYTYKIIESKTIPSFRVSYIYLDGSKLSIENIDSLRSIILTKYKNGSSFLDLVKEYNMDGNPNGDLGWFTEGMMIKDFEIAVREHKTNDIFTIDIPSNKWYYVVLKAFDEKNIKTLTVLKVKSST